MYKASILEIESSRSKDEQRLTNLKKKQEIKTNKETC